MANPILTPVSTDESVRLLDSIFGLNWHTYLAGGSPPAAVGVIFSMLSALNTVVLAGVALLVAYVLIVGAVGTAHEGRPLGQRYSTLWAPLRGAFAVALLMPLPWAKGLSALQALLLLFIYYGIGAANHVYSAAIDYMSGNAGQVIVLQPPREPVEALAAGIIEIETARHILARDQFVPGWSGQASAISSGIPYRLFIADMPFLGEITVTCDDYGSQVCAATIAATQQLIRDLVPTAHALASSYEGGGDLAVDLDQYRAAVSRFTDGMNAATIAHVQATQQGYISGLRKWAEGAKKEGWISAGQYYWTIAGFNQKIANSAGAVPSLTPPDRKKVASLTAGESEVYVQAVRQLQRLTSREKQYLARGAENQDGMLGMLTRWFSTPFSLLPDPGKVLTEGDAVANLQSVGHGLINVGLIAGGGLAAARVTAAGSEAAAASSMYAGLFPGLKEGATGAAAAAGEALRLAWTGAGWVIIPLILLGVSLAYYLPAIPFVLWSLAVIGWLILIVESLVAAPLWAAAHAIPEGDGAAGQHGRQGYMLFMGVLFRPPLMVIGLMAAFLLVNTALGMIGRGFLVFATGMQAGSVSGIITAIVLYLLCGALVLAAAHRIFGLITWLPDNVLRWIGQQMQNLGEGQDEDRTRVMVGAAVGRIERGGGVVARAAVAGAAGSAAGSGMRAAAGAGDDQRRKATTEALQPTQAPGRAAPAKDGD